MGKRWDRFDDWTLEHRNAIGWTLSITSLVCSAIAIILSYVAGK